MKATTKQKEYFKQYYKSHRLERNKQRKELYYKNHEHELELRRKYYKQDKLRLDKVAHQWTIDRLKEVVKILGGCCCKCGYNNVISLEVHHKDDSTRKTRRNRDYLKLDYDLSKVELLCANCHKEIHYGQTKTNR